VSKLIKNWSYLLVSDVIQQMIGFFVVILLARKLSVDDYGFFNVILSAGMIFSVFAQFGMSNVVTREIAVNPDTTSSFIKKIIIPFRLISFLFSLLIFFGYDFFQGDYGNNTIYIVLIILNLSLWNFSESIAFGHETTKYSSILNILFSLCWLVSVLIIPEKALNVSTILLVYCILHGLKGLSYGIVIYNIFYTKQQYKSKPTRISFFHFIKMILPYFWLVLLGVFSLEMPIQLLNKNGNNIEVAYYVVGYKLMLPISIAVSTAFKAMFPMFTKLYSTNRNEFESKLKIGFKLIFILGTFLAIISSITSKYFIPLLFGSEYINSTIVFNFLIWFSIISILDTLLSNGLSSAFKEKIIALLTTIDILILLPLLYIASFYGAWGIGLAKLISGLLFLGYHLYVFKRALSINILSKSLLNCLFFYLTSMLVCLLINNGYIQISILIIIITIFTSIKNSPIIDICRLFKEFKIKIN